MNTTERIVEAVKAEIIKEYGDMNTPIENVNGYFITGLVKSAIDSVIWQERPKIDLNEDVYYKNLLAVSKNIVMVIESKQWDRLSSHVWSIRNAIELCEKSAPPLSDLTPPKTKEDDLR